MLINVEKYLKMTENLIFVYSNFHVTIDKTASWSFLSAVMSSVNLGMRKRICSCVFFYLAQTLPLLSLATSGRMRASVLSTCSSFPSCSV